MSQPEPDNNLPQHLDDACEHIDAAMFTGDCFLTPENEARLKWYIGRWQRQMEENQVIIFGEEKMLCGCVVDPRIVGRIFRFCPEHAAEFCGPGGR
jgi:hypothetical protein